MYSWMMLVTFCLFFVILGMGHLYLWRRLVRDTVLPTRVRTVCAWLFALLALSQPFVFLAGRHLARDVLSPVYFLAYLWMGVLSTLFSLWVLVDLTRLLLRLAHRVQSKNGNTTEQPESPEKRKTLNRLLAGGVATTTGALTAHGVHTALSEFRVVPVEITLDKLPAEFDGFQIAQLSDIHVGPTIGRSFIERMVDTTNRLQADLIAITGDLVDGSVAQLRHHTEPLGDLRAPHGVYFVTGNHEYYSGAEEWIAELARLRIPTLQNERVEIRRGDAAFDLVGVNDYGAGSFGQAPDLAHALRSRPADREVVLLAHQPAEIYRARDLDVGLQLSGHTHGGQFWPWSWVVHLAHPVVAGLAQFGRTQIYVNTGTGYWGPPVRIGTEPEITLVTLRSPERLVRHRAAHTTRV